MVSLQPASLRRTAEARGRSKGLSEHVLCATIQRQRSGPNHAGMEFASQMIGKALSSGRRAAGRCLQVGVAVLCLALGLAGGNVCAATEGSPDYDTAMEEAIQLYAAGAYDQAVTALESLTQDHPDRSHAFLWLARAATQIERWDTARDAYKRYAELRPTDAEGPFEIGEILMRQQQYELAQFWYGMALERDPNHKAAKARLEEARRLAGEPEAGPPETPVDEGRPAEGHAPAAMAHGLVGLLTEEKRVWGHVAGAVLLVVACCTVGQIAVKRYRLPLLRRERTSTWWMCLAAGAFVGALAWGYAPAWRAASAGGGAIAMASIWVLHAKAASRRRVRELDRGVLGLLKALHDLQRLKDQQKSDGG